MIPEAALEHLQFSENEVDEVFLVALNDLLAVTPRVYPIRAVPQIPEDFRMIRCMRETLSVARRQGACRSMRWMVA